MLAILAFVSIAAKPRLIEATCGRKVPAPPIKPITASSGTAITNVDVTSHALYSGGAPVGDFTAMAWLKLVHDADAEKTLIVIGGNPSAPLYRNTHWVYLADDGSTLAMGSLTPAHFLGTGGDLQENVWHHVALVGNTDPAQVF
ncbi:MAG: hypothetical protein HY287_00740 [Planctomycetes bacterium]|nr:hypothetical protein [Planctomycetota bacterium]MBI3832835.1 hypothetical protein [Planctomycetota bacterium]